MSTTADTPITVKFGATVAPIHEQLGIASWRLVREQRLANAITLLHVDGVLTDREKTAARKRLLKKIHARYLRCFPIPTPEAPAHE